MGIIRILHNLSFIEDPTRIIRAVRFEQRLGFKIADQTLRLIYSAIKHKVLKKVSTQRIQEELLIMLNEKNPLKPLQRLHELGILQQLPISLVIDERNMKILEHINSFVQWYRMVYKDHTASLWLTYLFGILQGLSKSKVTQFFKIFAFTDKHRTLYHSTIRAIPLIQEQLNHNDLPNSRLYFLLINYPDESLLFLLGYFEEMPIRRNILYFMTELKSIRIRIRGTDLLQLGLKPGPRIRQILDEILKARLDNRISSEQEMEYAREYMKLSGQKHIDNP